MVFVITSLLFVMFILYFLIIVRYKRKDYYRETKNSFFKIFFDKGLWGEYQIACMLEQVKGYHKTLINVYIPNGKGGTAEIDLIFLHETGVYVIESKNYSGWIFGREKDYKWCQSFPNGRKEFFYNPIKQNDSHIHALRKLLHTYPSHLFHSIIVFSERCTLKNMRIEHSTAAVMKRNELPHVWTDNLSHVLSKESIDELYTYLLPFANASEEIKQQHIAQIRAYEKAKT